MKLVTTLKAETRAGKTEVKIFTDSKGEFLMREESIERHHDIVERVHQAMTASGARAHRIKVIG